MSSSQASNAALRRQVLGQHKKSTKTKGMPKPATLASYVGVFLLIITLVAIGYQPPKKSDAVVASAVETTGAAESDQPSIDAIVANTVAGNIAERTNLPVAPNLAEQSVSLAVKSQLAQSDETVITKPQIVEPTSTARAIQTYVAKRGDTVQDVAAKYAVSVTTIKWANDLTSDALEPGKKLTIPPVDGVVYKVQAGDTVNSIASTYKANKERIVAFNDLERTQKLKAGTRIIVPGGVLPNTERPGYEPPQAQRSVPGYGTGGVVGPMVNVSAGNRYAPGNCTWYAYERRMQLGRPVGSFWGNGGSWGYSAQAAGYRVDNTPEAGAVLVEAGSPGHVAVVESVKSNGDIRITEMNNYAYGGYGIVNWRTISAGQASGYQYIH